jgi:hypothetical protein
VDVNLWRPQTPAFSRKIPRVLHAPSRSIPPIKGSELIEPVLRELHKQGAIEYIRVEKVPHAELRSMVLDCDILVDQILTGSYGVAAVEAMSAGRLVVGLVAHDVRALLPEQPPIVDVQDGSLEEVFSAILSDPKTYAAQAIRGPEYARRWHDGTEAARVLADFVARDSLALKPRESN